jgi:hypothetical protein
MPPDRDLDRELRDLGPRVEYPPVPDLARSVRGRLEAEDGSPESSARSRLQLWWIAAAALALLIAVPAFSLAIQGMGGGASGGSAAGGSAMEENRGGAGDVAERGAPTPKAMESGASAASVEGACASPAPILEARPARGAPGDEFGIRGRYFVAGFSACDDTGSGSPAAQTVPARDVRVEFLQGGRTWELGSVPADKGSRIASKLKVPADARPGRATVRATYGQGPPESPDGRTSIEARFFVTG